MAKVFSLPVSPEKQTDEHLALLTAGGDTAAYSVLVKKYQRQIYHVARRVVFEHEDAEDVVQETFIKAFRNIGRFNPELKFFTWLYKIAINSALNVAKKKKRKLQIFGEYCEDKKSPGVMYVSPDNEYELNELKKMTKKSLENLSPEIRTVFILRVYDERSYKEIADILDISIGTVMSRLSRARKRMRKFLEKM